ncbi:HepT-like ribonuclease domain-containing protein [Myceligenerans pegani]
MAARLVAVGRDRFFADEFVMLAAEAVAIRLGESINRMDKNFLGDHGHLGLRPILSARHVIAHGYDIIDHEVLWDAYTNDLPPIASAVRRLLDVPEPESATAATLPTS